MTDTTLVASMVGAWQQRASDAIEFLHHAVSAPALFKPEAIERARRDYALAVQEMGRWSA